MAYAVGRFDGQFGYEDERFVEAVSRVLHCSICLNVLREPAMCQNNEHLYCRSCISRHLMTTFHACPVCHDHLTIQTLKLAPPSIQNLLDKLKIHCDYFERGCVVVIELGDLERHTADCCFAPAVCFNEGCQLEVNKHHLFYHATFECEYRSEHATPALGEEHGLDNRDTDKRLQEVTEQMEKMTTSPETIADEKPKNTVESVKIDREPKIAIAGGECDEGILKSVKVFTLLHGTWVAMQSMNECRTDASSVLHQNSIFVMGGLTPNGATASVEKLSLDTEENNQTRSENVPATLPSRLVGHCCAVYNQRLMVVGGYNAERSEYSNSITEISLVPPYVNELLATMPTRRCYHGVAIFGDRILIVGGRSGISSNSILRSVVMYDIIANEFQELAPLPYPVHSMATVKWRDNVIIMGGVDRNRRPLNKVFMYNINEQESRDLPNMNHRRKGCVAAIVEDAVIVMGGEDEEGNNLKSVEKFTFVDLAWTVLPEMPEERNFATAIAY